MGLKPLYRAVHNEAVRTELQESLKIVEDGGFHIIALAILSSSLPDLLALPFLAHLVITPSHLPIAASTDTEPWFYPVLNCQLQSIK